MPKKSKYQCIRCGYETEYKTNIHKHFFLKNEPCPQTKNQIDLTDEIKEYILKNRIYKITLPSKTEIALADEIKKLKLNISHFSFRLIF